MRYVWNGKHWCKPASAASAASAAIIRDAMEPLKHPVSGEILDSKSAFRRRTREAGCVELGNDAPSGPSAPKFDRQQLKSDIREAIAQLEQGRHAPVIISPQGVMRRYG